MFALLGLNCDQSDQTCCGADVGSRKKILGHPLGQSASFFEIYPFRLVQVVQGGRGGARDKIHRSIQGGGGGERPAPSNETRRYARYRDTEIPALDGGGEGGGVGGFLEK